jgi:hypothetical protein
MTDPNRAEELLMTILSTDQLMKWLKANSELVQGIASYLIRLDSRIAELEKRAATTSRGPTH